MDRAEISALHQGDSAAYEAVFRLHYTNLCAFAARLVSSWDDAEEVVQNVFSTIWQKREQLCITTTLKTYLYTAVRNEAFNSIKHRRVVDRAHQALAHDDIPPAYASVPLLPDIALEHDEVTARVRTEMAKLPARVREVMTLRWEHGLSYDDIGAILGIRPHSAKMQQSRALAMLRKRLSDLMPPLEANENGPRSM